MYNKLFTKILDSSIWLEPTPTRIVWVTMIAAMDEDGFCSFASPKNVANRALVTLEEAQVALQTLEAPDSDSSDPENEGRRLERVDGGWIVLNASKYRAMATREVIRERTKERVRKHREKKQNVTTCNADTVTAPIGNAPVTQSEQYHSKADQEQIRESQDLATLPQPAQIVEPTQTPRRWLPRQKPLLSGACHPSCAPPTWEACSRGMCVPPFLVAQWRQQLGNNAEDQIKAFVIETLAPYPEGMPFGDEPLKFWRGKWSERHGTKLQGNTKASRTINAAREAAAIMEARKS